MGTFVFVFNLVTMLVFTVAYSYHFVYAVIAFVKRPRTYKPAGMNHRFFVLVSARNESAVIGNLIDSIFKQDYPRDLFDLFVVADNCTDDTAQVARDHGAIVFERCNAEQVGKSWVLDYAIKRIASEYAHKRYEAMIVFDADNVIDRHFISEMNKAFDSGYRVCTSYRNSKNFESSWVSASSSMWFFIESRFLMQPRSCLKSASCLISGTGFMISTEILKSNGGWPYHCLTEDIEFSISSIIKGERVGFVRNAILYDEQPITFEQSWSQRMRWARGFYQIIGKYCADMVKGIKSVGFACFDAFMTVAPAMIISALCVAVNALCLCVALFDATVTDEVSRACLQSIFMSFGCFYVMFFIFAGLTLIAERRRIYASTSAKLKCLFTFPVFMITYFPIAIVAMVKKVDWKPIAHTVLCTESDIVRKSNV